MGRRAGRTSFFDDTWMYRRKIPAAEWTRVAQRRGRGGRVCFLLVTSSLHKQRKVTRSPKGSESLCLCSRSRSNGNGNGNQDQDQDQGLSPAFGARAHLSLLVQRKVAQRKHTLPTRLPRCALQVHSAGRIFRRYIPVSSKNDVHPCTSPRAGSCLPAPSLRKGPGRSKAGATATATATAEARAALTPTPLP